MEEIGKILPCIFKKHAQRADPQLVEILTPLWPRVAGKAIADHSKPLAFGTGTLTLGTPCPSWAAQLRQMAEEIRAQINSYLGGPVVKKLRVKYVPELAQTKPEVTRQEFAPSLEVNTPQFGDREASLDPETARILERSFAKYFSRSTRRTH